MAGNDSERDKITTALVTAMVTGILAFVGAAGGAYITAQLQQSQWETEVGYAHQQNIFRQRLELIERMSRILNQANTRRLLSSQTDAELAKADTHLDPQELEQFDKSIKASTNYIVQFEELDSEFGATASLAVLSFGPETREALERLQQSG
jgi:hypothetical protein